MRPLSLLLYLASGLTAATYYVDSRAGADANPGTSAKRAWQTLARVNATEFKPGDRVLFRAGSAWQGQLAPRGSGSESAPIRIDRYGAGSKPRVDGEGRTEDAILLRNVSNVEIRNFEATNRGAQPGVRRGVHILIEDFGTARNIVVADMYVHDVNGSNEVKDNGGIIFRNHGPNKPTRFDGLTIERNIVWKVDRSAIAGETDQWSRRRWNPNLRVAIRDNYVDDVGGDGIVPWATDGVIVEHNIARECNRRAPSYNAGIWPWSADNSMFQLNEASFTRNTLDSEGFDSDFNSRNTVFQYNYSHDNEGGFMLICTPGKRDPAENLGNLGTIVRHNISRNDRTRIFHLSAAEHTLVHDNAIYVGEGIDVQLLITTDWEGWADDAVFRDNLFYVRGAARYGHETKRNEGLYEIGAGWGPAKRIVFEGNRYVGRHIDRPEDPTGKVSETADEPRLDWNAPTFDPAHPEGFNDFLAAHRKWMLRLFEGQFGAVKLQP